jgi:transposase-like protein
MIEGETPKFEGVVEVDEMYLGGRQRGQKGKLQSKDVVIGIRERGGGLRLVHTKDSKAGTVYDVMEKHISKNVKAIMTDESGIYNFRFTQFRNTPHGRIRHRDRVYVRGDVHTNTVESAFSLLKRGIIGSFHQVSIKHLQRYLNEFGYRFNRREDADMFEQTVSRLCAGKALPYAKLTEEHAFTPFVRPS